MANIIIGCEESQTVCLEFLKLGHNAFSCDIQECSGGNPDRHIIGDILKIIKGGVFKTQSGKSVKILKWDALIGFPPCTFISNAGARWMFPKAGIVCLERLEKAKKAKDFFMELFNSE